MPSADLSQEWPFSPLLQVEHVWDAFTLLCLLEDCDRRRFNLQVPHEGEQKSRFSNAVRSRNDFIQCTSQSELAYQCNKCVQYSKLNEQSHSTGK